MRTLFIILLAVMVTAVGSLDAHGQRSRRRSTPSRRSVKVGMERQPTAASPSPAAAAATTTASGLTYLITRRGTGRQPKAGETVVVHYTGTLSNGVKFDSSRDRGEPFAFKLAAGRVIKGWDEGVAQLRVGDEAMLVIPAQLGYGSKGAGNGVIPPDSTLVFFIEVIDIKAASLSDLLSETMKERGIEAVVAQYHELKSKGLAGIYTSESDMNAWGYRLMRNNQTREAIEVLKLNVETYPKSANVYDSLAEAYMMTGNKQLAIENYKKALEIDPRMESARKALEALEAN
ncbi:MAG TPA: FKBP-type peptidyl-prolyl cis-trans isomerase [Pyrinomonadaceae bacterium]|nr:FKBP-type peptidyl-prolyl cis-trans isomerase [Pyrinomonadaceae bacterium]